MNIVDRFSSSLGRRDQAPNQAIAREIVQTANKALIEEIIAFVNSQPPEKLGNDAVMTLMAVSELNASLLTDYIDFFISLLDSKSNRQVWGSMTILCHLATISPKALIPHLALILSKMDEGTVVTRDRGFVILIEMYKQDQEQILLPLIMEQILNAPPNQLGQYSEKFMAVSQPEHLSQLKTTLEARFPELENESHRKRIQKILMNLAR